MIKNKKTFDKISKILALLKNVHVGLKLLNLELQIN